MRKALTRALLGISLLGFATGSVHAAAITDAKTIRITQNLNDGSWLMIAEIEAYDALGVTNYASQANGGVASASSSGFGSVAGDVNDGNTDPYFWNGSVWHAGGSGAGQWVQVDLLAAQDISTIDIYLRSDTDPHWSSDFQLQVWDSNGTLQYDEAVTGYGAAPYHASVAVSGAASVPAPGTALLATLGLIGLARRQRNPNPPVQVS